MFIGDLRVHSDNLAVILPPVNTDKEDENYQKRTRLHERAMTFFEDRGVYVYPMIKAPGTSFTGHQSVHMRSGAPESERMADILVSRVSPESRELQENPGKINFEILESLIEEVINEASL